MNQKKLIIENNFSLGDIVLLSAAVRDLHLCYPGQFVTDIRTPYPELWEGNPRMVKLDEKEPEIEIIKCSYPLIQDSNERPYHVLHGFVEFLNDRLKLNLKPTAFKGDIHLSAEEKSWDSQVQEIVGQNIPFWIIVAGGKMDVTIKWWEAQRYQQVVDHFRGKIQFVQVGAEGDHHPNLKGVLDLRGKTDVRQLIRLVYHSQGVVCPVTSLMHLAAAVESKAGMPKNRACVVVAGGREPMHWEAYPHHQFIHTGGALLCCDNGGCWKSRTVPLGDGDERDKPANLCVDVKGSLPRCMDMITSQEVIRRIELYFEGGALRYLTPAQAHATKRTVRYGESIKWEKEALEIHAFRTASETFMQGIVGCPKQFEGRGIVICGGGETYFPCAWVCISMLRRLGCSLPIQFWHLGKGEADERMVAWLKPLNVECVDALTIREQHPARILNGWELKPYAILHSPFKDVLLLDADNVPVVNPEFLFETRAYRETGAIFWPDEARLIKSKKIWEICGAPFRDEPEFDSGQIVVDKEKCWRALSLSWWYNEHSDFYYQHTYGDKETFHVAFAKLNTAYAMPKRAVKSLEGTMCQHDFRGRRIFQHRNTAKWKLIGENKLIRGFRYQEECLSFLRHLRRKWKGVGNKATVQPKHQIVFRAPINNYTGYGLHSCQIISDLARLGYELLVRPTEQPQTFAKIPWWVRRRFVEGVQADDWELFLHPPNVAPTPGKRTIYFTMWEATRLPLDWAAFLNQAECVVVPCQWNASCFSGSGVTKPIRVIPLGIKTNIFRFSPMHLRGPCVFGAAGKMRGGGERKGLNEVVTLFQRAFPNERDVRLRIKGFPDCGIVSVTDPRVDIKAAYVSEKAMAHWYASLTCFVSVSRSEGWGLMPHQAMAVGRPCIALKFGGHAEFLHESNAYCADFKLVPAGYNYSGGGVWAEPDSDHIIELMRRVYRKRKEAERLGKQASQAVSHLTWEHSNRELLKVLQEFRMVS